MSWANLFASVKYFLDHRPFSFFAKTFNVYNSKNTEPIELKFTHNIRVGPVCAFFFASINLNQINKFLRARARSARDRLLRESRRSADEGPKSQKLVLYKLLLQ